jgi:hypothetical protein
VARGVILSTARPCRFGTSVFVRQGRGFVTGTAFHGYCVSGNLPEMPYPLTELVKASRSRILWLIQIQGWQ